MIFDPALRPCEITKVCFSTKTFCESVKNSFQFIHTAFNESSLVKWWQKYEPQVLLSKTSTFVVSGKKVILEVLARTGQWHEQCGSFNVILKIYENATVIRVLNISKMLSLIYAPYALYKIIKFSTDFFSGNASQKIEAGLEIINESSSIIDSVVAFGRGLYGIGLLSETLICGASPLAILSTVFSTSSICLNVKNIWHLLQFSKQMKTIEKDEQLICWLNKQDTRELGKLLKCNGSHLKDKLAFFSANVNHPKVKQQIPGVVGLFKKRVSNRITCESLSIISSTISLIGITVLFIAGANPLGYVLVASSAGIYTVKYVMDKFSYKKLDSFINKAFTG